MEQEWDKIKIPSYIYLIHDPSQQTNEIYIGKTISPHSRCDDHLKYYTRMKKKSDWVMSVYRQGNKIEFIILEEIEESDPDAENFWIEYFRSIGANVLNSRTK